MASAWPGYMKERLFGDAQIEEVSNGRECCPRSTPSSQGSSVRVRVSTRGHRVIDLGQSGLLFASSSWNCSGSLYVPSVAANSCSRAHVQLCTERRQVLV